MEIAPNLAVGAQIRGKGAGLSWFMTAKFQNAVAIVIIDNRKTEIYGDPTGVEALTRHVAVQGMVLSRCL